MISDTIKLIPYTKIVIGTRREVNTDHVRVLADSIARDDLIHALVIEEDTNVLCVGRHRLAAWEENAKHGIRCPNPSYADWKYIPVRYAQDYSEADLARIELIENLQHRNLTWQEEAIGIAKIHKLQTDLQPGWIAGDTATLLGMPQSSTTAALTVAKTLKETPELISACGGIRPAYNIIKRKTERTLATRLDKVLTNKVAPTVSIDALMGFTEELEEEEDEEEFESPILNESFHEFVKHYTGERFNFLHCDFPYGINLFDHEGQGTRKDASSYDDSPEVYWELLTTLAANQDSLLANSCHIMFWFSQNLRRETEEFFATWMPKFALQKFLMIWNRSDNSGLCPDPQRYGRRNYETAFLLTRGDRKIVKAKNLLQSHPGKATSKTLHRSEKPYDLVRGFLEMFIDDTSVVLDPTCGSGTALRAALSLEAKTIVGLEIDPEMQQKAAEAFSKFQYSIDSIKELT